VFICVYPWFIEDIWNRCTSEEKHQEWSKKAKKEFNQFRYKLKLERRGKRKIFHLIVLKKQNITSMN
jgi:hypothetical protein